MFKRSSIVVSYAADDDRVSHDVTMKQMKKLNISQLKD